MWCCLRWRRQSFGDGRGGGDDDRRARKHRELEAMPQRRDLSTMAPRRDLAAMPPGRRETVRATTEFRWPPRMGDAALSPRLAQFQHAPQQTSPMMPDTAPEKEGTLASPTTYQFAPEPVYLEQDYHISPQVSQVTLAQKFMYGQDAPMPELAELPPNELVPQQVHELAGPTPPLNFAHELEGSPDTPRSPRSPTPTSRFSSRR